jgi:hypothetical protein
MVMDRIQLKEQERGAGEGNVQLKATQDRAGAGSAVPPIPVQLKAAGEVPAGEESSEHAGESEHAAPVQLKAAGGAADDPSALHETAAQGVAGAGGPMPHLDKIQQAFGAHDVTGVQAHTDGAAAAATGAMGAEAYASGNSVAFGSSSPSLHTAAHEAAHVVQQRGGVQLKGGVGAAGDSYEQHADAVADAVVQGKSAAPLLDQHAGSGGGGGAVQHKALQFEIKADLRQAMKGWGCDDNAIIARIQSATAAEMQSVLADAALINELKGEMSRANLLRALDLLAAPVTQKLRLAMNGWGHDEAYIFRTLNAASPAELAAVAADNALVAKLKDELSRASMIQILDRINFPLARKIAFAMDGWGCDDQYITNSVARAPIGDVVALAANGVLMAKIGSEMSGKPFADLKGMMARRIFLEAANANAAWALIDDPNRSTRAAHLLSFGSVVQQRQLCDAVIAGGLSVPAVSHAFESYWNIDLAAAGGQAWTIPQLVQVHAECKRLPEGDVRNGVFSKLKLIAGSGGSMSTGGEFQLGAGAAAVGTQPYGVGTTLAAGSAAGATTITVKDPAVFTAGATISVGHGTANADVRRLRTVAGNTFTVDAALTHAHGFQERVTPDDQTAIADVQWLPAVIRHEIAHSVDTALGGLVRSGFTHGLGGFDSGISFETWAGSMPGSGFSTNDGSVISSADQGLIKAAIEAAKASAGNFPLSQGLAATHPIVTNWNKDVPVIEAAKPCIAAGQGYWQNPEQVRKYGTRRFAINLYYHEYQYYNEQVHGSRVRDYSIFAPAEFFAEVYTVFYEQVGAVPDAQLGARVPVASWRDWIRNNVHNRGLTPAAPTPAGAHPATPGASPTPTVALPSAGVGKGAANSGHV